MNNNVIGILCLEDSENDALFIREHLKMEGLNFQYVHVSTESEFSGQLKTGKFDIILSDYNVPGFSGLAALLLAKKICPDVPFICISGNIGEDLAVEILHIGAADYISKDKLSKLPLAIKRALKEVEERKSRIDAERQLMESEARFRDILMSSYDWVWEIDRNFRYCYTSDTISNILGYSKEEVLGKSPFDFMPQDETEIVGPAFQKIASCKGVIKDLENWNIHKDGHRVCLLTNGFPIFDEEGQLIGYRGVDKDITDRKLAEEEIRKLSRATEQSPVSVLITDLEGNIIYANPIVTKITGYSFEELIGNNPRIFASGEMPKEEYKILWETISSGREWKGEFHNKKKSGELYWESTSISPILNEKGIMTHYLAIKEDITERKRLTSDLIEAKSKAEASDRLKTAFLNNISHEVRTPLNGILGFSELIMQPELSAQEKTQCLELLIECSDRLVGTISNYMDISLLISGNMYVRTMQVDPVQLLERLYRNFLPRCRTKGLELIKHVPSKINASFVTDEGLLEKALTHLLDNSVKFTTEGRITMGLTLSDNSLGFSVSDTGSGIDPRVQNSVFKAFMQGELSFTRGYEGSGLGLSITKGIVDLLGGSIRMESEIRKGSVFYLTLPVSENVHSTQIHPVKQGLKNTSGSTPVVLIAEDDKANSFYLTTILRKASIKYVLAGNGKEAVDLCTTHDGISLVLMDIKMPVMDGLEATRRIKEFRKNLPVFGVSAFALAGEKEKALEAGCDKYFTKPIESDKLLSVIQEHLGL